MKKYILFFVSVVILAALAELHIFANDDNSAGAGIDNSANIRIDNQNVYDGMDKAYCDGYVPGTSNGYAYIVLPLLYDGNIKGNVITAGLNLGESESNPFVCKNYEKNVYLTEMGINNNSGKIKCYPVVFSLELKQDRINGSYPVTFSISGKDENGADVSGDFTVYVNITDGKNAGADVQNADSQSSFVPKLLVESYTFSKDVINGGDDVTVHVRLHNMSDSVNIKNATISIEEPETNFTLLDKSSTQYIGDVAAGSAMDVAYTYNVSAVTPQGQYNFAVSADYADEKGNPYTSAGTVRMKVNQPVNVGFGEFSLGESLQVADVANATVQVMNLGKGKIYNVRAEIEGDGLKPEKTIFVGDVEPGQEATGEAYVDITGLSDEFMPYGDTTGKITYYYTDESGNQLQHEQEFNLKIESPFSEEKGKDNKDDKPEQWWWIMGVICVVIVAIIVIILIRKVKRRMIDNCLADEE